MKPENLRPHHTGIAVSSIRVEKITWELLGYEPEGDVVEDKSIGVKVLFMTNEGNRIELVEPLNDQSPAYGWILRKTPIYHMAFLCRRNFVDSSEFLDLRWKSIFGPIPAQALQGKLVEFYINPQGLMIELIYTD